mmetsp:Transcript_22327/g.26861  ORF Transcript_22327/g.26861 Transcript_22327/m.26861 type:complete len:306 (-) Transcript_22327:607-1524(-)|eukprot:CAMPEP_0197853726 /NCGR_PEP_ID=MMETSP1438-20131217/23285_1 /TAXON_ID=1461541 /ORGANISM="Pterosperma sp., Strain CCMP1384" /LENGTH=305 /DNA_ID=CAMNT_0043468233 /DNA_START=57 /DNA_END=974 /DNA_ORIENTATION=+
MVVVTVVGKLSDGLFQRCKKGCEYLMENTESFEAKIISLLPVDYETYVKDASKSLAGDSLFNKHKGNVMAFEGPPDNPIKYIGAGRAFLTWLNVEFQYTDKNTNSAIYERLAKLHLRAAMKNTGNTFVYFDIAINGKVEGKLVLELYEKECPKTVKNFVELCKGCDTGNYKGTPFHRVVNQGWIQGGDISEGKGDAGKSIYGPTFADESFAIKHDNQGIIGMVSVGPHTNASQFYITLAPLPWLDGKTVAFGRIMDGGRILKIMTSMELENERPMGEGIVIQDCGLYTAGAAPAPPAPAPPPPKA